MVISRIASFLETSAKGKGFTLSPSHFWISFALQKEISETSKKKYRRVGDQAPNVIR